MKHTIYCLCLLLAALWLVIPMSSHAVNIFAIQGVVKGTDGVPIDALLITVTNETKNLPPQTGLTGDSGPGAYAVVLINFTVSIADLNDEIKITVEQEGTIVAERTHTITQENLDNSRVVIDVQLEEKKSAPNLISILPDAGVLTGGETVQLIGENFQDGATVTIGGNQATEVVFVSSTQLTAETPQGEAGVADVTITNPDEQSVTLSGVFTYIQSAPVITQIDPISGPIIGSTVITITPRPTPPERAHMRPPAIHRRTSWGR
ncbi:MAG: IPT/TIG domain-containing protein, partial [Candidatus Poribacteria bacterium]